MDIKFAHMARKLSKFNKIILYGAGNIAGIIYDNLLRMGINIDSCVVTNKDNGLAFFKGVIPVYQADEYLFQLQKKDTIILVAVSKVFETEIKDVLKGFKLNNYLLFSDFDRNNQYLLEEYRNKTKEKCIEEIAEWYIDHMHEDWKKFDSVKQDIESKIYSQKRDKNKIVIAVGDLKPRVIKIAKALLNEGKEIKSFFYPGTSFYETCNEEFRKIGFFGHQCICVEELMYNIILEQASVVHIFSQRANTIIAYVLTKMKEILPPIVYDEYDIINEIYYDMPADWLEEERYCLEHADGICNRGYELDYLSQKCGYDFQGKTIHFLDYCRDRDSFPEGTESGGELSICYAGGMCTEREGPDVSFACWMELAQKCTNAKCHFHIYPSKWSEARFSDYIELEKQNEYFHFHHPVPNECLCQELSQYDYGVHPIRADFKEKETEWIYKREKMIYATTNHFFDYIDAGVPIIAAAPVLYSRFFETMGVLLPWTIEEYDFEYLKQNRKWLRKKAIQAREELQMKHHIKKLLRFYQELDRKFACKNEI